MPSNPASLLRAAPSRNQTTEQMKDGDVQENKGGERRKMLKLKIPVTFRRNRRKENHDHHAEDKPDCVEEQQQQEEEEEQLEKISRRLIVREQQLFSQDFPSEQEEDQLHKDLEDLMVQIWMAINNTFTSSSPGQLKVLRSAVASIQQQEEQDRRWTSCLEDQVPVWRPQKCLSTHYTLLQNMVESRLKDAAEEDSSGPNEPSSPVKKEVLRMGKRVKMDLLKVVRTVKDCYPPQMDILNLYAGLYHQGFSTRLTELAASGLEVDDCSYLLLWVNHCYPCEILKHEELDGKVKAACLGSLLPLDKLNQLEEQYLTDKQDKVKLWLSTALKKEEESWLNNNTPETIDSYYFSPLAVDVIQMIDGPLTELKCVIRDQSKAQRIIVHLEHFFSSYKKRVEEFVKGSHRNVLPVIKAHLVCEEQLREYITGQGILSEEQRRHCLDSLSALRDCGYRCFTCPIRVQLKACYSQLWTPAWFVGSLLVVDSLLNTLNQQLTDLADLKPVCRQSLLCVIHEDVVLRYVKRMMKTRMKTREQQVAGAQRMVEDAQKINDFFSERGCSESSWLGETLRSIAEILRLQDPGSVQLEMVSLARTFPDLSEAHVLALLSLKADLSAADVRSIRRSVEENRCTGMSANHSPAFFCKVKVKWINNKINQMGLKT
ncbi:tumor necrosis factor alpha-induced protein 2-like isoform X3 [Anabas testudineus]|uniref:Tumor necrosis factor alpha-induced protein 2-like n=1 Tax=Anabas testudineus TaxID=64144 RepID=A0A7N6F9T3_ANATE|nr:tumor necrosis factor alpha-induced protein 2-like isoform X3 [Anabas testudineus]